MVGSAQRFPAAVKTSLIGLSRWSLVTVISAIGMNIALRTLKDAGAQAAFIG